MNAKTVRNTVFYLHRILGLAVGLVLIIIGLTGSLLVFQHEINHWMVEQQFGHVTPQAQQVSVPTILDTVQTTFANQPNLKLLGLHKVVDIPHSDGKDFSLPLKVHRRSGSKLNANFSTSS